jgi:hypothetical protein
MRIGIFILALSGLLVLGFGCTSGSRQTTPAFYYWQTTFRLSSGQRDLLDSLACRRLYVKFLDIGIQPETGTVGPLSLLDMADTAGIAGKTIIPCVFITNNVFGQNSPARTDWLAVRTIEALNSVGRQFAPDGFHPTEVQFDCDWTASTRAPYFAYLQAVRAQLGPGVRISATIRLHQYKQPDRTGVPPVDRGMLMFYNTGDIDDPVDSNSIFQPRQALKFLRGAPARYPLPLDVVLPVFSWGLVYRDDALWKIIPGLHEKALRDTALFVPGAQYAVKKGTFLSGHFLRPGDMIRLESVSPALLDQAAGLAAGTSLAPDAVVGFYHLDTAMVGRYGVGVFRGVLERVDRK